MPLNPKQPIIDFGQDYRETAFHVWYREGRPELDKLISILPTQEGRKPRKVTISRWKADDSWIAHADALDGELSVQLDQKAIDDRKQILEELAATGGKMVDLGIAYLEEHGFDSAAAAVRAVLGGMDAKFKYGGRAEILAHISGMNDAQITRQIMRLLGKNEDDNTIEGLVNDIDPPSADADDSEQ